jgi:hypothetical protein
VILIQYLRLIQVIMIAVLVVLCLPLIFICNFLRYGRWGPTATGVTGNSVRDGQLINTVEYNQKAKQDYP